MDKKVEIRKTLKEICDKDGMLQWEMHIIPVLKNAMNLAEMLKADKDVLEMGAYLHDIARISGKEGDHHTRRRQNGRGDAQKGRLSQTFHRKSQLLHP